MADTTTSSSTSTTTSTSSSTSTTTTTLAGPADFVPRFAKIESDNINLTTIDTRIGR